MILKSNPNFEEKLFFCLKIDMKNFVNFNRRNGKSEYLYFDGLLLLKVCNFELKGYRGVVLQKMVHCFKNDIMNLVNK